MNRRRLANAAAAATARQPVPAQQESREMPKADCQPVLVKVRMTGGAYLARCYKAVASCTSDAEQAAARAAGKVLGVLEPHVYLKPLTPGDDHAFWALPVTASDADLVGYKTASQIAQEKAAERDLRYQAQRSGPGSFGDRLD